VVEHAGARLLVDIADATGLTAVYSMALRPRRPCGTGHDRGGLATDLALLLADGGEAVTGCRFSIGMPYSGVLAWEFSNVSFAGHTAILSHDLVLEGRRPA
jgi:hypothetical protein